MFQKTPTLFFGHNFCEYWPIFKILSRTDSKEILYISVLEISTLPQLCCYTTLWNPKLQLLQLFYGSLDFVWDYPGEPVPER